MCHHHVDEECAEHDRDNETHNRAGWPVSTEVEAGANPGGGVVPPQEEPEDCHTEQAYCEQYAYYQVEVDLAAPLASMRHAPVRTFSPALGIGAHVLIKTLAVNVLHFSALSDVRFC